MYRVELSKRALRDLRRIDHKSRERLLDLLEHDLATEPQPANLDIEPLTGRVPWLRLRRGEYGVLYRPLTTSELRALGGIGESLDETGCGHRQGSLASAASTSANVGSL